MTPRDVFLEVFGLAVVLLLGLVSLVAIDAALHGSPPGAPVAARAAIRGAQPAGAAGVRRFP